MHLQSFFVANFCSFHRFQHFCSFHRFQSLRSRTGKKKAIRDLAQYEDAGDGWLEPVTEHSFSRFESTRCGIDRLTLVEAEQRFRAEYAAKKPVIISGVIEEEEDLPAGLRARTSIVLLM